MATGRVWAGFFHTRTRLAGQDLWPGPGPFIKQIFFLGAQTRLAGLHGPRWPRPKITNPKIYTNLESQIAEYNVIFLAIFLLFKRMPRSNKPIYTKNPTNPRNKISKSENPSNKTPRKPNKFGSQKKKTRNPNFAHKNTKKKKKIPNHIDCGSVTGEGWFTVDL